MLSLNDLTFGAELEFYLPEGANKRQLADAVSRRIGRPVTVEGYGHSTPSNWKIVTDGSLNDYDRGAELVSPIMRGEAGLRELGAVCDAASDFGATVSKSCGFHIHVGAGSLTLEQAKNLARLYQTYEAVIDAMMPPSRRGTRNNYCRSIAALSQDALNRSTSINDIAMAIATTNESGRAVASRYVKLNFASFARHRTVEFRQHSGTLEARKAIMWARACLRMVVAATKPMTQAAPVRTQINKARPGSKAYLIGEMFLRPEGVTAPEVLAATGWPAVSMPQQAKQAGLEVVKTRQGRIVRYRANRAEAQAPVTLTRSFQGWASYLEMNADETAYFRTRTENLSGPVAWTA